MKVQNSLFILLLICGEVTAQNKRPFSIEGILSSPFPSNPVVSATGKIAWVENAAGIRNIWVARPPAYESRQVTGQSVDDGQEISDLQFLMEEGSMIYVSGANANRKGEFPNPAIISEGVRQAIYLLDLAEGSARLIAEGSSPKVNPVRDEIVYINEGQIWYKNLQDTLSATQLITTRGGAGDLTWSPDGSKLAFTSFRGDHNFIGVYDPGLKKLQYLDPSVDLDNDPVWSPDNSQLAFIRIPNQREELIFEPHRSGLPWSIMVADLETGKARQVWKAHEGPGSVYRFISANSQLTWSANGYIVFPWEKFGWTNLFSVNLASGEVIRLTSGNFEVQFVSSSSDGQLIYYSSNENDIDRQHIWRSSVDGRNKTQLTTGNGIEWGPMALPGGELVLFASGPTTPARLVKWKNGSTTFLSSASGDFPERHLVEPEQVIFHAADGMKIHGQLFKPKDHRANTRYPGILFLHGGSRRQMLLGFHHRGYYHNAYALNQYLASQGYIVLSVNYRSGIGYGMEFREAINYGATGASEFNDVVGAGLYLKGRPDIEPQKIGLWGGSYGGYLTALGLARASDLFAAGVDIHGVHDWNVVIKNFRPDFNPNSNPEFAELAFRSSPLSSMETWKSPVLLIHGDDDRNVPFSETVDLAESLRRQGVEFEQLIFPDEVHGFLLHQNWVDAYQATADFFDRKLKN